ncbi:hypothetical protein [Paenibacillus lautus]|nr:hypothetical protein [Paenibacillus lautus]
MPHELMAMSVRERAAIYAMISIRVDKEKAEAKKLKGSKSRKR